MGCEVRMKCEVRMSVRKTGWEVGGECPSPTSEWTTIQGVSECVRVITHPAAL